MNTSYFEIFRIFFVIGLQLLGGGYVIVPLLKKYIVDERKWLNDEELTDFFALSQCIPGIIACNIATCSGYRAKGFLGAICAILGIIIPCFMFILILAGILNQLADYEIVQNAFKGIRAAVVVLIVVTIKDLWKTSVNSVFSYSLYAIMLCALVFLSVSPTLIIISAGLSSFILGKFRHV